MMLSKTLPRSGIWFKKMSQGRGNSQNATLQHGYKRIKTQKVAWRPVNTHSKLDAVNEHANIDSYSQNVKGNNSLPEVDRERLEDPRMKILECANKETESLSQVHECRSSNSSDASPTFRPLKSFISVKHTKSDVQIESVTRNKGNKSLEIASSLNRNVFCQDEQAGGDQNADQVEDVEKTAEKKIHQETVEIGSLIRFFIKKGETTQRRIERETGVNLNFVASEEETVIVINGPSAISVKHASQMVQEVIEEAVESHFVDYSHFISLPLAHYPELVGKLKEFQNSILRVCDSSNAASSTCNSSASSESKKVSVSLKVEDNIEHVSVEISENSFKENHDIEDDSLDSDSDTKDAKTDNAIEETKLQPKVSDRSRIEKSIFIKPATFHLTILMLKLWNKKRISAATEVFNRIAPQLNDALESRPLSISLNGLELMRGSPGKAHVLYARVKEIGGDGRLQRVCQIIIDAFKEAGLVLEKDARSPLKLHATLMNSRHRKRKGKKFKKDNSFDARPIIKQFGSYDWGQYVLSEAHLSERFSYDKKGYYHCCASINFPETDAVASEPFEERTS